MPWSLLYLDAYTNWLDNQEEEMQDEALAHLELLKERGPLLPRPYADTLQGSKLPNLQELRFSYQGNPIQSCLHLIQSNKA